MIEGGAAVFPLRPAEWGPEVGLLLLGSSQGFWAADPGLGATPSVVLSSPRAGWGSDEEMPPAAFGMSCVHCDL